MSAPALRASLPLGRPYRSGNELGYLAAAIEGGDLSAQGPFGERCASWLADRLDASRVLLTPSCTAALELAGALIGVGPGDEVVMPSFTSVSTAIAVTRAGATPVFADIEPGTLNLDPEAAAAAVTPRTRALVPVHYAGVGCDMEALGDVARAHGLTLIEDAAHGVGATWRGVPLGAIGELGCISFHDTKNVSSGEGGALVVQDAELVERAVVMQDKGTNRRQFLDGRVEHYTWVDGGSSFAMSELTAAFLWSQLECLDEVTSRRLELWHAYDEQLAGLEASGVLRRPVVPVDRGHNAHIYYVLLPDRDTRDRVIEALAGQGIEVAFHFVPLHLSPAGLRLARTAGDMSVTEQAADRLLRLPLWVGMDAEDVERVVACLAHALGR